jgi:predicted transcriptional regulator
MAKLLGPLEAELMEVVWASKRPLTARDVERDAGTPSKYVTVLTVLNNLATKGVLRRERRGKALVFEPVKSREEFLSSVSEQVVRGLIDLSPRIAVNSFVGSFDSLSEETLAELQAELTAHLRVRDDGGSDDSE